MSHTAPSSQVEPPEPPTGRQEPVAVLGAGAWGTVVASLIARNRNEVRLWSHRTELADALNAQRRNPEYAPDLALPTNLSATSDLAAAVDGAELTFIVVPTPAIRHLTQRLAALSYAGSLVSCSKGLEVGTLNRISQVVAEALPGSPFAALSGPNLAGEIALGLPAAATVASSAPGLATRVQKLMQQPTFRLYTSSDVAGVEAGGALKNVIALASGISDGLGIGENARASLITRGLAELVRLGTALGGEVRTFYGLAGLGDLVATCSSVRSRNHQAGVRLAAGESLEDLVASGLTAEGIPTVKAVYESEVGREVDLPISTEVYRVLFERKDPRQGIVDLMTRAERAE
ncbi:MAG: NAD(P)H-dependent glycerol-3-phosphate dehydrogenase [Trueperaceae bacterium]